MPSFNSIAFAVLASAFLAQAHTSCSRVPSPDAQHCGTQTYASTDRYFLLVASNGPAVHSAEGCADFSFSQNASGFFFAPDTSGFQICQPFTNSIQANTYFSPSPFMVFEMACFTCPSTVEEPVVVEPTPVVVSVEETPVPEEPVEVEPLPTVPIDEDPVEVDPTGEEPIEIEPIEDGPVEVEPVDEEPVEIEPVEEPVETPAETTPVVEASASQTPTPVHTPIAPTTSAFYPIGNGSFPHGTGTGTGYVGPTGSGYPVIPTGLPSPDPPIVEVPTPVQVTPVQTLSTSTSSSVITGTGTNTVHTTTGLTTSTVYATRTSTITSCAPTVTNCPLGSIVTKTIPLYTTICPYTSSYTSHPTTSPAPHAPHNHGGSNPVKGGNGVTHVPSGYTISTVYTTNIYTVTSCPPTVPATACPYGSVTTETRSLYTTICPVSATSPGVIPAPGAATGLPQPLYTAALLSLVVPAQASTLSPQASTLSLVPKPTTYPGVNGSGSGSGSGNLVGTETKVLIKTYPTGSSPSQPAFTGGASSAQLPAGLVGMGFVMMIGALLV